MANVSYSAFSWVGSGFDPGVEHRWNVSPAIFGEVVGVTAHAVQRLERELMIKDVRVHVDPSPRAGRQYFITVKNTGPNNIPGYSLDLSFIQH